MAQSAPKVTTKLTSVGLSSIGTLDKKIEKDSANLEAKPGAGLGQRTNPIKTARRKRKLFSGFYDEDMDEHGELRATTRRSNTGPELFAPLYPVNPLSREVAGEVTAGVEYGEVHARGEQGEKGEGVARFSVHLVG